jgi:DNA mismatch repair protein MutS2
VDQIKDGYAEVRVKALRFREKLENLELVEQQPSAKPQTGKLEKLRRSAETEVHLATAEQKGHSELNVIGQTTDEAVDAVDKFLDEASLASLSQVRIVHGHGTGALRRAIAGLLKGHPHVARFVAAPPDQGGTGATLVELRQ